MLGRATPNRTQLHCCLVSRPHFHHFHLSFTSASPHCHLTLLSFHRSKIITPPHSHVSCVTLYSLFSFVIVDIVTDTIPLVLGLVIYSLRCASFFILVILALIASIIFHVCSTSKLTNQQQTNNSISINSGNIFLLVIPLSLPSIPFRPHSFCFVAYE